MQLADPIARQPGGFTLVEMLIALALGSLVLLGLFDFLSFQQRAYMVQEWVAEMQQNARAAMDVLTREIRMAGYNPTSITGLGAPGVVIAEGGRLHFIADLNANGMTASDPNEDVTYRYDSANLRITRQVGSGEAQPVAERVTALSFTYRDAAGSDITSSPINVANIRQIAIELTTRTSVRDPNYPNNGGYRTTTLTTVVTPRNLQR